MYYSCIEECPYFLEMHTEVVRGEESLFLQPSLKWFIKKKKKSNIKEYIKRNKAKKATGYQLVNLNKGHMGVQHTFLTCL